MAKIKTAGRNESSEQNVRFRCVAPAATAVFLAGTFNAWDPTATPMQPDSAAEWYVELKLSPGKYEYKYVVDGVWFCEPGVADEGYAGEDAVVNSFGTKNRIMQVE
jgi:1,4-alpha-glucan branching enzyme